MEMQPAMPQVISFQEPGAPLESFRPAADRILAGDPAQQAAILFSSEDGRFTSGVWSCEPGSWRVVFTENEFCHLLEGVVTVIGDDGSRRTFRAGDAFATRAGFTGIWEVTEAARKWFACYE
jgi:uncharacterized cupin superfamily protein